MSKTLLIDLDGVLNQYKGNYNEKIIPPIIEGAKEFLIESSKNYEIKIFTTRKTELVKKWVEQNKIENYISEITQKKEPAWAYIDDRCINFRGDFNSLTKELQNFQPWWKYKKTDS